MCGIAGYSLTEQDLKYVNPVTLAHRLLLGIESRGRDATGVAWNDFHDQDPSQETVWFNKDGVTATKFVAQGGHKYISRKTSTAILHTRAGTGGSPKDDLNNHPIVIDHIPGAPTIIGVHNGVLWNERDVWKHDAKLAAAVRGEVDSQIIFQILALYGQEELKRLEGDASLAWLDNADPHLLHIAKAGGRELHVAQTEHGSVFFASTKRCLDDGLKFFPQLTIAERWDMRDGEHLMVRDGFIEARLTDFPIIEPGWSGTSIVSPYHSRTPSAARYDSYGWSSTWDDEDDRTFRSPTQTSTTVNDDGTIEVRPAGGGGTRNWNSMRELDELELDAEADKILRSTDPGRDRILNLRVETVDNDDLTELDRRVFELFFDDYCPNREPDAILCGLQFLYDYCDDEEVDRVENLAREAILDELHERFTAQQPAAPERCTSTRTQNGVTEQCVFDRHPIYDDDMEFLCEFPSDRSAVDFVKVMERVTRTAVRMKEFGPTDELREFGITALDIIREGELNRTEFEELESDMLAKWEEGTGQTLIPIPLGSVPEADDHVTALDGVLTD